MALVQLGFEFHVGRTFEVLRANFEKQGINCSLLSWRLPAAWVETIRCGSRRARNVLEKSMIRDQNEGAYRSGKGENSLLLGRDPGSELRVGKEQGEIEK